MALSIVKYRTKQIINPFGCNGSNNVILCLDSDIVVQPAGYIGFKSFIVGNVLSPTDPCNPTRIYPPPDCCDDPCKGKQYYYQYEITFEQTDLIPGKILTTCDINGVIWDQCLISWAAQILLNPPIAPEFFVAERVSFANASVVPGASQTFSTAYTNPSSSRTVVLVVTGVCNMGVTLALANNDSVGACDLKFNGVSVPRAAGGYNSRRLFATPPEMEWPLPDIIGKAVVLPGATLTIDYVLENDDSLGTTHTNVDFESIQIGYVGGTV